MLARSAAAAKQPFFFLKNKGVVLCQLQKDGQLLNH